MPFSALLPLATSLVGTVVQKRKGDAANVQNALTLANTPFSGQQAQGFVQGPSLGNNLLQGLAGSFKAFKGAKAEEALKKQQEINNNLQQQGLDNQRLSLLSQLGGGQQGGGNQAGQLINGAQSLFSLLGNGGGGGLFG